MWNLTQALAALGLGPGWAPMVQAGLADLAWPGPDGSPHWHPEDVRVWRRRVVARMEPVSLSDLRLVAMRLVPLSRAAMEARAGHRPSRKHLERLGLAVALRSADVAAETGRLGATAARLMREGYPAWTAVPEPVRAEVRRRWERGESVADIAAAVGLRPVRVRGLTRDLTPRWSAGRVCQEFGWSRDNVPQRLRRASFPEPDGTWGAGEYPARWWWPSTVIAWGEQADLRSCPECGARVAQLPQHALLHPVSQAQT